MSGHLTADRGRLGQFVNALFLHADEGGFVSLRSFEHERGKPPVEIRAVQLNGQGLAPVIAQATGAANRAARHATPAVFAPPICTFTSSARAAEADVLNGVALSLECDEQPEGARQRLEGLLGAATVVVASGGEWADPATGELQDRLHCHWRLAEPTRTVEEHAALKRARRLAVALAGGDPSAVPLVHPLRWPGSWHRKGKPKLCSIVALRQEVEIALGDALERLEQAAHLALEHATGADRDRLLCALEKPRERRGDDAGAHDPEARDPDLEALADAIPNEAEPRAEYIAIGLAFYAASDGSAAGLNAWDRWARKSHKAHGGTARQWAHFATSPPDRTGKGSLVQRARRHAPGFRLPSWRRAEEPGEDGPPSAPEPPQRPVIQLGGGRLHDVVAASERALGAAGGIYQRGALLVRVVRLAEATSGSIRRAAGSLTIVPMDRATLRVRLTEAARFERFDGRSEQWRPSDCPGDVAEAVLSAVGAWPSIPPLVGIVQAPTLRADGTVLDQPGYDAASGLLLDPGDIAFPPIPAAPSRAEAERALVRLRAPFADFPFAAEADLAVILSAVLTALVRPTLRAAPAFLLTAPTMGSGKTLLATIVSYIATGRAPAMMSQAEDAEAERKRLLAVLMEGGAVAVLDNIERPLASDALCSILTEPVFRDRVLGVTRTAAVPTNTSWFITGNNAQVVGDLTVRVLTCRLDPACERPEERTFTVDLHREVPCQRGELAAAALTIIRAYLAAGSPPQPVPTFGRFEQWQAWCRFPLIWLGLADPCSTRAAAEGKDPVRARLGALLEGWRGLFGGDELTVAVAIKALGKVELDTAGRTALTEAMREIAGEKDGINGRRLGNFIARHEGRFERGLRFERGEAGYLGVLWRVRSAGKDQGFQGFKGFRQPPTRECQSDSYIETTGKNPGNPANSGSAAFDDEGIDL